MTRFTPAKAGPSRICFSPAPPPRVTAPLLLAGRGRGSPRYSYSFSLQPALWRHLHEGGRTVSETRPWVLPGSGIEASVLRAGECSRGTLQSIECGFPQNASESRLCTLRAHSDRFGFALSRGKP